MQANMSLPRAFIRSSAALALTSVTFLTTSAFGQSAEDRGAAQDSKPKAQQSEIDAVKTENLALRELLRKIEGQQKLLLEQVDRLQRRLDGGVATDPSIVGPPSELPTMADVAVLT